MKTKLSKDRTALDRPVSDLPKLAAPAQRALVGAGIHRLTNLTKFSEDEVKQLHGIGPNALKQLRIALKAKKLDFADTYKSQASKRIRVNEEPHLEYRAERPYVAIRAEPTMKQISTMLPPLLSQVLKWLDKKGIAPAGAPFFRYVIVDMPGKFSIEVGVPVTAGISGEGRILAGVLPAGRYAVLVHVGPPRELRGATADLLAWAKDKGLEWDATPDRREWRARIESYLTDPAKEPDRRKWQTELAFMIANAPT